MDIKVFSNQVEASAFLVDQYKQLLADGAEVFGLATGGTPEEFYKQLGESDVDFSDKVSINLDEYYGLTPDHPKSYHYYMEDKLFHNKPFAQSFIPKGDTDDVEAELERYNGVLADHPIDVQLLGIGTNGHIGFNEPGSPIDGQTQFVDLTQATIEANARFFENIDDVPTKAISMGLGSIMAAKKIILIAFGDNKADAIEKTVNGPVTTDVPASILQNHDNVTLVLDEAAAAKLK